MVTHRISVPSTARLSNIWKVTSSIMLSVFAKMSPNPTVAKTVTVKYNAEAVSSVRLKAVDRLGKATDRPGQR